ncbi:hypothetical protein ACFC6L_34755 [Kitasatospora phosalacinea]|uniref:hypothetical protein n=1 Tax=Kitasatospora phosalacinea TaxID=2065 RepID=UPI0035DAC749
MPASLHVVPALTTDPLAELCVSELAVALYVSSLVIDRTVNTDPAALIDHAAEGLELLGVERVTEWGRRLTGFLWLYGKDLETPAVLADHRSRFPSMRRIRRCHSLGWLVSQHLDDRHPERREPGHFPAVRPLINACPCEGSGTLMLTSGHPASCPAHDGPAADAPLLAVAA